MRHHRLSHLSFDGVARIQFIIDVLVQLCTRRVASKGTIDMQVAPHVVDEAKATHARTGRPSSRQDG